MTAGPMARPIRGVVRTPMERSRDFKGSAIRLVKRLTPQRGLTAVVILLGIGGIAIGVIGPRILGHATDLLFNGVIGRQLPAGLTKEQAIAAARARGDNTFADLLSGMNVVPGRGVDFGAVGDAVHAISVASVLCGALLACIGDGQPDATPPSPRRHPAVARGVPRPGYGGRRLRTAVRRRVRGGVVGAARRR